jgi:hypothetical protein
MQCSLVWRCVRVQKKNVAVDDERGADVQRAAGESGPQDCEQRVGIL